MNQIKQFEIASHTYFFVEGENQFIISEDDFCHTLWNSLDSTSINFSGGFDSNFNMLPEIYKTYSEIKLLVEPVTTFKNVASYWGIKSRIRENYKLFLDSMKEIGLDISEMPKWGE